MQIDEGLMVFVSSEEFSDSPLVFWEYVTNNTKYRTIWIVFSEDTRNELERRGIACILVSNGAAVTNILQTAKYVIMDGRMPLLRQCVEGQVVVQTSAMYGFTSDLFMTDLKVMDAHRFHKYNSAYSNIFTASSYLGKANSVASYAYDARKVYVTGVPRCDAMHTEDGRALLLSQFPELAKYKKIIGFFPAAKDLLGLGPKISAGYESNIFNMDDFSQSELESFLEENGIAIVFKMHPFDEYRFRNKQFPFPAAIPKHCYVMHSKTFFGKTLYHILNAFDCLISDFSGIVYEYLLLNRPIIFIHNELHMLMKLEREFFIKDENVVFPGKKVLEFPELLAAIDESLRKPSAYLDERIYTRNIMHRYFDGENCERLLNLMETYDTDTPAENIDYEMYSHNLLKEVGNLASERDELLHVKGCLADERDDLLQVRDSLVVERRNLQHERDGLQQVNSNLLDERNGLLHDRDNLQHAKDNLLCERDGLMHERSVLIDDLSALKDINNAIQSSRSYRFTKKIVSITIPVGSCRRKFVGKIFHVLRKTANK